MARQTTTSSRPEPAVSLAYGDNSSTVERRLRKLERKMRFLLAVLAIQSIFAFGYICAGLYLFDYITRHYTRL